LARIEFENPPQIGARMGLQPSGKLLVALDIDGAEGEASLDSLALELGPLPRTLEQRTPSGGRHLMFEWPGKLVDQCPTATRSKLAPKIDLRGRGGQIILAPSPGYELLTNARPALLPGTLVDRIIETHAPRAASQRPTSASRSPTNSWSSIKRARRYVATMRPAISGSGGHQATWRVALVLMRGFALAQSDAMTIMLEYNARCEPPWSLRELEHKLHDADQVGQMPRGYLLEQSRGMWCAESWRPEWDAGYERGEKVNPQSAPVDPIAQLPTIYLGEDAAHQHRPYHEVVEDAERVLGIRAADVYARGGRLVDVGSTDVYAGRRDGKRTSASIIGVRDMPESQIRVRLSACAHWVRWRRDRSGNAKLIDADPPLDLAHAVGGLGRWPHVRPLSGVLSAPSLRPDGSIIQVPGWDETTGYLYEPDREYPLVPETPTILDSRRALADLLEPYEQFWFRGDADRCVPISLALSLLARPAIAGNVPMHIIDATTAGAGKGLAIDVACIIGTGRPAPKATYPGPTDELEKILGGHQLAGSRVVCLDNVDQPLCGAALEKVLTTRSPELRVLGRTGQVVANWIAVVCATGNQVVLTGDMPRRCLVGRIEPPVEDPSRRDDLRIPRLDEWTQEHRARLVVAGLTLLRAYALSGEPYRLAPFGSFEHWAELIASAISWAGGPDLMACRLAPAADPRRESQLALLTEVAQLGQVTASDLLRRAYETSYSGDPIRPALADALEELLDARHRRDRVTAVRVGHLMRRLRDKVIGGLRLVSQYESHGKVQMWKVVST
jgi:hypothetical protein